MKNSIFVSLFLNILFLVFFSSNLIANEKVINASRANEKIKLKSEIKEIEITGFLIKVKYTSDIPESKELISWYVNTKLGILVLIPDKDGEGEKYFNQYEGKEVIVKGIGEVVKEKNDKGEKVTTTKLSKFVSIELRKGLRLGDRKGCIGKGGK